MCESYRIEHLVVDSSPFLQHVELAEMSPNVYSVDELLKSIRNADTREKIRGLPYEIHLDPATSESFAIIREVSKKTGDYSSLSLAELHLLALTRDLYVKYVGKDSLSYEVKNIVEMVDSLEEDDETLPFGFVEDIEDDESDSGEWVGEANLAEVLAGVNGTETLEKRVAVGLMSANFAVQNVALQLKMNLIANDGSIIRTINSQILRCRACHKTTSQLDKEFCPKCGNKSLQSFYVTANMDGLKLHVDFRKLSSTRGQNKPTRSIKGGKHDNCDQFFEDQKLPHNRAARLTNDPLNESPFAKHDITSRAARMGIRPGRQARRR